MNVSDSSAFSPQIRPTVTSSRRLRDVLGSQSGASNSSPADESGVVVTITGSNRTGAATLYSKSSADPAVMQIDYYSFGDRTSLGSPSGPTRLEYNVYRPDGLDIDASTQPFTIKSTGEKLTEEVARKVQAMLLDVTEHHIAIYKAGKNSGLSNGDILAQLQSYDRSLPATYRALVGNSDMTSSTTRYGLPTRDEAMRGPVHSE